MAEVIRRYRSWRMRAQLEALFRKAHARPYNPLTLTPPDTMQAIQVEKSLLLVALTKTESDWLHMWLCSVSQLRPGHAIPNGRQCAHVLAYTIPGAGEMASMPGGFSRKFLLVTAVGEEPHSARYVKTFFIRADERSITCLRCRMESFAREDVQIKYCGRCHQFHDEVPAEKRLAWLQEACRMRRSMDADWL